MGCANGVVGINLVADLLKVCGKGWGCGWLANSYNLAQLQHLRISSIYLR